MAKPKELLVNPVIDTAYQVVKYVALNMCMLVGLNASILTLTTYMPGIQSVLVSIPTIANVSNDAVAISNVSLNMVSILNINNNLAAILAVSSIIAAQDWKNSVVLDCEFIGATFPW